MKPMHGKVEITHAGGFDPDKYRPPRITPDEARLLRHVASNLRLYANEPFTGELDAESLRGQARAVDDMTNEYPDDWPTHRGSHRAQ